MARFPEAEARIYENKWVCLKGGCGSVQRSPDGKPDRCRKCGSTEFRIKHKSKKK